MIRFLQYTALFAAVVLLQEFLFGNLRLSVLVNPSVYLLFLLLLPMDIAGWKLLLLAFGLGAVIDFMSGTPGIHTIATVAAAFVRPSLLTAFVGKDVIQDGGIPVSSRIGARKFLFYSVSLILVHDIILFTVETLSIRFYLYTLLRIALSTALSAVLIYFGQLPLFRTKKQ